jgi:hypothetical protein
MVKVLINTWMFLFFSITVLIKHLWQHNTDIFLHSCLISYILLHQKVQTVLETLVLKVVTNVVYFFKHQC